MSTADTWSAEFASSGRVVFPPRRKRLVFRLVAFGLLTAASLWTNIDHLRQDDISGLLGVLRITALAAFVYGFGWTWWQLATGRPVTTIDGTGISHGRGRVAWEQISRIDAPTGVPGLRTIHVRSTERSVTVGIPQDNVEDIDELARWLRTLHEQHQS
jgi:hypothetical protein